MPKEARARIGLYWYVVFFNLLDEIEEALQKNKNAIYQNLYRNTGYSTKKTKEVLEYIKNKYSFDDNLAHTLFTEQEFKEKLLTK